MEDEMDGWINRLGWMGELDEALSRAREAAGCGRAQRRLHRGKHGSESSAYSGL